MIYILLPCYNEYKNLTIIVEKINKLTIKNSYKIKLIIPKIQSNLFFFLWIEIGFLYTTDLAPHQLNCQNLPD